MNRIPLTSFNIRESCFGIWVSKFLGISAGALIQSNQLFIKLLGLNPYMIRKKENEFKKRK